MYVGILFPNLHKTLVGVWNQHITLSEHVWNVGEWVLRASIEVYYSKRCGKFEFLWCGGQTGRARCGGAGDSAASTPGPAPGRALVRGAGLRSWLSGVRGDEAAWCRAMMGGAGRGCLHHPLCHCLITTNTTQLQPVTRPANTNPSQHTLRYSQIKCGINTRPIVLYWKLEATTIRNTEIGRKSDIFNKEINILDDT